jgi:L-threonylcarbamoyladenylate synthase
MLEPDPTTRSRQSGILDASAPDALRTLEDAIRSGAVVAFPTDTVYALAASLAHPAALARLYEAKGRPEAKAIPVLLSAVDLVDRVALQLHPAMFRLVDDLWPGPLTVVVPARAGLPDFVTTTDAHGVRTIAIRVPDHALAREIIEQAGGAIAATSANLSGKSPALTAGEVLEQLGSAVDLILDGGPAPRGVASTIITVGDGGPVVLRTGSISARQIECLWQAATACSPEAPR